MSRQKTVSVFATVEFVSLGFGTWGKNYAFAADREGRTVFLHWSQARKILIKENGNLTLVKEKERDFSQMRRGARLFVSMKRNRRGWRAVRWGFAPRSHQQRRRYRKDWYDSFDVNTFSCFMGAVLETENATFPRITPSWRGKLDSIEMDKPVLDMKDAVLTIKFSSARLRRAHENEYFPLPKPHRFVILELETSKLVRLDEDILILEGIDLVTVEVQKVRLKR